jgi:N-methylhydantoinase A/oxoprolinase/acetone carboxylase beta subunit
MRYQGQNYEQEVPVPGGRIDQEALAGVYAEYGRLYEGFYGYTLSGIPIEIVRLAVVALGEEPTFARYPGGDPTDAVAGGERTRPVFFPDSGFADVPLRFRATLGPGTSFDGPAIVESMDSTVVVGPGWTATVRADGILDLGRRS